MTSTAAADALDQKIAAAIRRVAIGELSTYGGIAERVGLTRGARRVARMLAQGDQVDLPWHRILRSGWRIAFPLDSEGYREQRVRLLAEGHQVRGSQVLPAQRAGSLDQALWGPETDC